jgi:CubicO group peptidase (beta-lactamase class C family)
MADIEHGKPITPRTVFDIASTSKQFTAFSILLLAREGRLTLEDDVRRHIPELPDYGERVTIGHLVFHTSGIPEYDLDDASITTNAQALASIRRSTDLDHPPGAIHEYSNAGYFLLGRIVERVSGRSLRDFAQERIFGPLGMEKTFFYDRVGEEIPGHARGYGNEEGGPFVLVERPNAVTGDGNVRSTVLDLARWAANLSRNRLGGGAGLIEEMLAPGAKDDEGIGYGFGIAVGSRFGRRAVWHEGSWHGFSSQFLVFPDDGLAVILLSNHEEIHETDLADRVAEIYLEAERSSRLAAIEYGRAGPRPPG